MAEVKSELPAFNSAESAQKTIEQTQQDIVAEFKGIDDWLDKYNLLIQLGKTLPAIGEDKKTDEVLIKGCQMRTWYQSSLVEGRVHFEIDSMSLVIRGAIVLLMRVLEGRTPAEIKNTDLHFIDEAGLRPLFSPTNANSLWKMVTQMQTDATTDEKGE
ncbi:MAG: SufE family protein [Candidatus Paceibacterota bacterium]